MITKPPQEAIDLFRRRTSLHIQRVRDNIYLWQDKHTEFFEELSSRASNHDKSKFFEPELTPYIWLTWENHCLLNNIPLELDQEIKYSIAHAISHHITKNRHHPEFHSNPDNMTKVDLIEMVCDWKAIGQEMGEKSPMDYANRVLGEKFHFSPEKCEEIKKIIIEMDEMCDEEEKIKKRLEEITPSNKELLKMVEKQYGFPFKYTFNNEYFDFIIVDTSNEHHPMTRYEFDLIFKVGKKNGVTQPPVSREELKELADFIYKVLESSRKGRLLND